MTTATLLTAYSSPFSRAPFGAPPLGIIAPGSPLLRTTQLKSHAELQRTLSRRSERDTAENESVRVLIDLQRLRVPGGEVLLMVRNGRYSGGPFSDSLMLRADGLAPVWEHIRYPGLAQTKLIDYHGNNVNQINRIGDSTRSFTKRFRVPVFAFTQVDLAVTALPLRAGYRTLVPLYSEGDDSLEIDTVSVTGLTGRHWTVRFADPAIVATYTIDTLTRHIDRYEVAGRRGGWARRAVEDTADVQGLTTGEGFCTPATGDARAALDRSATTIGLGSADGRVLHLTGYDVVTHDYESDRMYPPFLSSVGAFDIWLSPSLGAERTSGRTSMAGSTFNGVTTLGTASASYVVHDTALVPNEQTHAALYVTRPLNAWSVIEDWRAAADVRVVARCQYRDYPRLVLSRAGLRGEERLFLNATNGIPVKLERVEPHYLWGQVHAEYVYSTWRQLGDAYLPGVAFRVVDGSRAIERAFSQTSLVPADSAPSLHVPRDQPRLQLATAAFLAPVAPDTVRVTPTTFLLKNPGYTEVLTLAHDTVFVLDATQGEARARQDSAWISRLFPGPHPIVVVVTDLAWPHVAGVRYWVAQGATIIAPSGARRFLETVVDRRWTLAPDLLEQRREHSEQMRLRFRAVSDTLRLAGGGLLLFAIDGRTSEVAIAAFSRPDRFLWASDYVQTLTRPTATLDDVWNAVHRVGVQPERFAAEHLALSAWATADRLARSAPQ